MISRNHCSSGKAIIVTYSVCVCVCSFNYPTCKVQGPYYIITCGFVSFKHRPLYSRVFRTVKLLEPQAGQSDVILGRARETSVAVEKQCYIFLCVCVGVQTSACACKRVALLIQCNARHITVCGLSGSNKCFDIMSLTTRFSEKSYRT